MGKYDQIKYLKRRKATTYHECDLCHGIIEPGNYCYTESQKDKFLHFLHAKHFCCKCYDKYGDQLLSATKRKKFRATNKSHRLDNFL